MKFFIPIFAAAVVALAPAAHSQQASSPRVVVDYLQPDNFTDVSSGMRGDYLDEIKRHVQQRAGAYVPQGQRLAVTITDVDMAGRIEPWQNSQANVRIVRDVYPPRIALTFKLADADGAVLKQGGRELRDLTFMQNTAANRSGSLRYEKTLLDNWLQHEFANHASPR